ncbi:MAG: peptidylprolyl isomerase [Pseudomonadota bacterium]|nr:peptidylprolyl isomerase [Pseudomonadota bacterium]
MLKKWLREPLLHFLLIGAALFILYGLQNDETVDNDTRIVISEADIDRLLTLWEKKWQRPPGQSELDGLIEAQIRQEVLYREALAMGLDKEDSIVHRRLAQKVEFIFSDIASQAEPTDSELTDYLAANADKFETPARISFQQIYLNSDKRGDHAQSDANHLLDKLTQPDSSVDIMTAGDSFMFGQQHENLTEHGVARLFGKDFASKLFSLPSGAWQGPVRSGYGLHLVQISNRTTPIQPSLDAVRQKVLNEWHTQQRQIMNEQFYQNLRTRYEIVIEDIATKDKVARSADSGSSQ